MQSFFQELFQYNHQSNLTLIEAFVTHQHKVSEKSVLLFSHILNAHHIWNNRIDHKTPPFGVWDTHDIQIFTTIHNKNSEMSTDIINRENLARIIAYQNSKGERFENSIRDILFHIINHSTYHRAQIATEFKNNGIAPLVTDYIFYKR